MTLDFDYHVHSTYSDGGFLPYMTAVADELGLEALGFADHCVRSDQGFLLQHRDEMGFTIDRTLDRRRAGIETLQSRREVRILDGVEIDYDPPDEDRIADFLADAGFEYVIGSVHFLEGHNVHDRRPFRDRPEAERAALVERYFEKLEAMIASGLFDIAAHIDIVERNPALRGLATREQYERIADALADADVLPEVNAGRVLDDYGEMHPTPAFRDVLLERGIGFTVGSDAHGSGELRERHPALETYFRENDLTPRRLDL